MDTEGFVPVLDIITVQTLWNHQVTPDKIVCAVRVNLQGRFQLKFEAGVDSVRAVQGHSRQLALHYGLSDAAMLQTLTLQNAPRAAVHGTSARNFESIRVDGLHRDQRQHFHFITGEAADGARSQNKEIEGFRASGLEVGPLRDLGFRV